MCIKNWWICCLAIQFRRSAFSRKKQTLLNCQITSAKKINTKICLNFPTFQFFWDILKSFSLDVRLWAVILDMVKIPKPLVKKETSDVLSSRIILNDWNTMYLFKLKRTEVMLRETRNIHYETFIKQVNLVSSIIITKKTLIKVLILNTVFIIYWKW